nr:lipopolysaccharide biosynthesis protein [uncultured Mucilaginibacter sp.]
MSGSKKIFGGIIWTTLGSVVNALYGFFSVPLLLVHFGKEQYGLIGLAMSVNVYLRLMDMGFSSGNVKYFSMWLAQKDYVNLSKLFQSSLSFYGVVGIVNALILFIVTCFSQSIFSISAEQALILNNMFYVLMISAFFGWIAALLDQFLRANEIIGWEQRLLIVAKILQILALIATLQYNLNILTFFSLSTLSALIVLPFSIWKITTLSYKVSIWPRYHHKVFMQVLPYCMSVFSFGIFQFSAVYLRPVILGIRSGMDAVANYRVLDGVVSLVMIAGMSFVGVILPYAAKAKALKDKEQERKIAYDATKYITIFLAVIVFGFVLISKDLLYLYVGKNFEHLYIWLNVWIITILGSHNSALSSLVLAGNRLRPIVYMSATSTIVSLLIACILAPHYNVGSVVIGYFLYVVMQISFYYFYYYPHVMQLNSFTLFKKSFFYPAFSIGVVMLFIYVGKEILLIQNKVLNILISGSAYVILVLPVIYFLLLNQTDKEFLTRIIFKKQPANIS